jgi:hypothetical protein
MVAGSLALLTVSTVVAFQGWPGLDTSHTSVHADTLATASAATRSTHDGEAKALVVAHPAPVRRATPHKRPASHRTTIVASATPVTAVKTTKLARPAVAPPAATAVQSSPPVTAKAPAKSRPAAGDPVRKVGAGLGGTVADAGTHLNGVLANVSPTLGKVVQNVANAVAGVVAGTSQLVAGLVDRLVNPRNR